MAITPIPGENLTIFCPPSLANPLIGSAYFFGGGGVSTGKLAYLITVPRTGTLDKFETMTMTQTGGTNTMKFSFQDPDASTGFPDGTLDQYRGSILFVNNTWTAPGLMTSDGTDGGSKRSVTKGDKLYCVIQWDSFPGGTGFNMASTAMPTGYQYIRGTNICATYDGSSWGQSANGGILALKYNDGTYEFVHPFVWPIVTHILKTFNTGTSANDEYGLRFQLPFGCELIGGWARINSTANYDVILYTGTTATATLTIDKDYVVGGADPQAVWVRFPTAYALTANTTYRLIIKPSSATDINLGVFTISSAAHQACFEGGLEWYGTHRVDAGAWTDETSIRPLMGIILSGIDTGSAGGGETSHTFVG